MKKLVGIFFGSDTGNTKKVANMIYHQLGKNISDIFNIAESFKEDIENYDNILFGISTWYYGELQSDWDNFLPILKKIDFSKKKVAIFGCGDQEDYAEYFCDAMNTIKKIVVKNGAYMVGSWPIEGYHFNSSKSVIISNNKFIGLAIDEDRQPEKTDIRVQLWIEQIREEMNIK